MMPSYVSSKEVARQGNLIIGEAAASVRISESRLQSTYLISSRNIVQREENTDGFYFIFLIGEYRW
jgi:hypothetical protein